MGDMVTITMVRDLLMLMPKLSHITAMVITVILMPIVMDTIMERGPLMLSLLPQLSLKPQLMLSPPQPQSLIMVTMVMVTVILMPIITVTTTAKGLLMLSLITAMDT